MLSLITSNLLWQEGMVIVAILACVAAVGWFWWRPLFFLALFSFAASFYFFRNPERVCPQAFNDENILVCPADGTVVDITYDAAAPFAGYPQKISIFLSPLDVHVNWIPMSGKITKITYWPGSFMPAFLPKSSLLNEHNDIHITSGSRSLAVRQIAGTVARRICCWLHEGQEVKAGDKYGMIRFGSRVDIMMPAEVAIEVGVGQRVCGGQTVIGRWK